MFKRILISGLLGGIVLILWTLVTNVFFGFKSRIDMKQIPNEKLVHQVLKENIVEPGGYMCNPPLAATGVFPLTEPVYSIRFSGMGHEAAALEQIVQLALAIIAAMIGAWLLAVTSSWILSTYSRRVFFVSILGLWSAVFSDLTKFGIGGYPLRSALLLAANDLIAWTLVGLVVSYWIRPDATTKMVG